MIKDWLDQYKPTTQHQATEALREIMQTVALAGLQRSGFFDKAAFYGGTELRIFYGLNRFSEDLDFSLLASNPDFAFEKHFESLQNEFEALGMAISIKEKRKTNHTSIESAFLKSNSIWRELVLDDTIPQLGLGTLPNVKVKLEVDIDPPPGFHTEEKLLLKPFSFYVKCFVPADLYAGKMHALLFRKWKQNVKGRDWYDMEWYIKNDVTLNLDHFLQRAQASGDWTEAVITKDQFIALLQERIDAISMDRVKDDIIRFIPDPSPIEIWSKDYFKELITHIKFK